LPGGISQSSPQAIALIGPGASSTRPPGLGGRARQLESFARIDATRRAAGFWWISEKTKREKAEAEAKGEPAELVPTLVIGRDYHVFVRVIEFFPTNWKDKAWDGRKDAPDPFYRIYSEGTEVFESERMDDTFLAVMSPLGVDLLDAIKGHKVTLSSVLQAAPLHCRAGAEFELAVFDNDPVDNDLALRTTYQMEKLQLGDNVFEYEKSEEIGVKRIVIRVIDADAPVAEQVKLLGETSE